jgi:hypothetical protein
MALGIIMKTNLKSFEIRTSHITNAGMGVFATHDIPSGTYLELKPRNTRIGVFRKRSEIPQKYISYCIAQANGTYLCPANFENMEIVWYLNHSKEPNAELRSDGYYSVKDINKNEEILIVTMSLQSPNMQKRIFIPLEDYPHANNERNDRRISKSRASFLAV